MVDLSSNCIEATGARAIVDFAFKCFPSLTIVKLHKNSLGDRGTEALAPLVRRCELRELHLSHNGIGTEGCRALLQALREGLSERSETIFIRLENNRIQGAVSLAIDVLGRKDFCCRYDDQCTRHKCAHDRLVHLPMLWKQEGVDEKKERALLEESSPSRSRIEPPHRGHSSFGSSRRPSPRNLPRSSLSSPRRGAQQARGSRGRSRGRRPRSSRSRSWHGRTHGGSSRRL